MKLEINPKLALLHPLRRLEQLQYCLGKEQCILFYFIFSVAIATQQVVLSVQTLRLFRLSILLLAKSYQT